MSEIRVTSVVGENGGDRVGLTTGLTVGPLTGTTGIGATITHQGHAQFAGVCTATSFVGSGANLTGITNTFGLTKVLAADTSVGSTQYDVETASLFDGTYDTGLIVIENLANNANDSTTLRMLAKVGGSYVTSGYKYTADYQRSNTNSDVMDYGNSNANVRLIEDIGNANGESLSMKLWFSMAGGASESHFWFWNLMTLNSSGVLVFSNGAATTSAAGGALSGFRFYLNSGNMGDLKIAVYGYTK